MPEPLSQWQLEAVAFIIKTLPGAFVENQAAGAPIVRVNHAVAVLLLNLLQKGANAREVLKDIADKRAGYPGLIVLWEDVWTYRRQAVEGRFAAIFGKLTSVYMRECEMLAINNMQALDFMRERHLLGAPPGYIPKRSLGITYGLQLAGVACFERIKKFETGKSIELSRYVTDPDKRIVGGLSKVCHTAIHTYGADEVITFLDRDWSAPTAYLNAGFTLEETRQARYFLSVDGIRKPAVAGGCFNCFSSGAYKMRYARK